MNFKRIIFSIICIYILNAIIYYLPVKEIFNSKIAKYTDINAMVIYPFILYKDGNIDTRIRCHELIHINQIKRFGVLNFYAYYNYYHYKNVLINNMTYYDAYINNPFEIDAYTHEYDIILCKSNIKKYLGDI